MRRTLVVVGFLALVGCRDLQLPEVPTIAPGVVRATVLTAEPGRNELVPARGATLTLLGTTQQAIADQDGNVTLEGLHVTSGRLLFALGPNRSRIFALEAVGAGFGKDVNLGQVILGRNATLVGRVLREDRATLNSGHGGVVVFLPQLPQLTLSGDDGAYRLTSVPEGDLVLSFSTPGYRAEATSVHVGAGEELRVDTIVLAADPGSTPIGQLSGLVQQPDGTPIAAVTVRGVSRGVETVTQTSAEGRFVFGSLDTGVYVLGLEKNGLTPLRVDGVLVSPGLNEVGPYVMTAGTGSLGVLDGGTPVGIDAGPIDAGTDAGMDGGSPDAGMDAGIDAGFDAGSDAGSGDAGSDPLPVAIVVAYQVAAPSSQVTLNGTASTGSQPLTYTWTQLTDAGVMLNVNGTATSHSPRFTAPSLGTLLDWSLVVTDRFGRPSTNTAIARVGIGSIPVARFGPDAGTFTGGDLLTLTSTSFDDGGLLLTTYDWQQTPTVPGATLIPNGNTASLSLPPLMMGALPVVIGVELRVTNSIGAQSPAFRQSYAAQPGSGANWALTAALVGPPTILFNGSNPPARINSSVNTAVQSPNISYAWSCPGLGSTLNPLSGGAVEFAVPNVVGPDRVVTCTVTATGQPPLNPAMLQATAGLNIRDDVDPAFIETRPSLLLMRSSPLGVYARLTEPANITNQGNACNVYFTEASGTGAVLFAQLVFTSATCTALTVTLSDGATAPNAVSVLLSPAFTIDFRWQGPFVSTNDYLDPQPAVVSASQLPFDLQRVNPPAAPVLPFELVAREGADLVTFGVNFLGPPPACNPSCPMADQRTTLGLDPAVPPPLGERVANAGQELFVALQRAQDAGLLDTLYARRRPDGTWTTLQAQGELANSGAQVRRVRLQNGALISDVFDPMTSTFVFPETVLADAGTNIANVFSSEAHFVLLGQVSVFRTGGSIDSYRRNPGSASWDRVNHFQPGGALYGRTFYNNDSAGPTTSFGFIVRSLPDYMMGVAASPHPVNMLGPVTGGFDFVQRADFQLLVVSQNGDLRLYGGRASSLVAVAGPPRAVPLAPGDNRFDHDVSCEAAWPRLALMEDALVLTWQERCSPSTRWKVITRVLR